ncbi:MAG: ROK family glucokinase [Lachnospiraceae bacterium]|nr:ROK family glucokinase [Lachnospiraceae bacterium]
MAKCVFGVDIGGTTVKVGFLDIQGNLIDKWEIPTRKENGGENILPDVARSIEEKLTKENIDKAEVAGIGVGVPGPVDGAGVVHRAVNLGWGEFNVSEKLTSLTGIKSMAGNDANVAALGEMWKGGGQGYKNMVMVTLGTGVGGGIIIDGKMLAGSTGAGGEIGHIHIDDDETRTCGCGNKGCLEQYASATGISYLATVHKKSWSGATVLNDDLSAKAVFDGVKAGDALCKEIAEDFGEKLGKGLAVIASVVNPEAFVIGGGVSKAGEVLMGYIRPSFEKYVFHGAKGAKLLLATLGNDAGMYGAAKLVL